MSGDPIKDALLSSKLPKNFDSEDVISAYMRMSPEEQRWFLAINDLLGQRRTNEGISDVCNLVTSAVSKEDVKDFMALQGVGSFGHIASVNFKKDMAEVASQLPFFAALFGIPLLLYIALMVFH
jgi:hypothetical protein